MNSRIFSSLPLTTGASTADAGESVHESMSVLASVVVLGSDALDHDYADFSVAVWVSFI